MPHLTIPTLFIINNLYSMGGAERNLLNLLRQDNSKFFDALVVTSQQKNTHEPFSILKTLYTGQKFSMLSALLWVWVTIVIVIIRFLHGTFPEKPKKWRPRIIHGYLTLPSGLTAVLLGKILRRKSVVSIQGQDLYFFRNPFLKPFQIFVLQNADQILVQTQWQQQYLIQQLKKKNLNITILPNGIVLTEKKSVGLSQNYFLQNTIKLLFIGRLIQVKQPLLLLDIIDELEKDPDMAKYKICLTIIGQGPLYKDLFKKIHQLHLEEQVEYYPYVPHEQIRMKYYEHDILIVTSTSEGLPNVILEAMAAKRPIVTTYFPGLTEVITNNHTGIIVFSHTPKKIALAIKSLLFHPIEATRLSTNAYNYVKYRHAFTQIITQQHGLYLKLI